MWLVMAAMGKVFGVDKVVQGLARAGKKHREIEFNSVIVGYTASYALHVHENLNRAHGEAYNEKYAEQIKSGAKDLSGRKFKKRGPNQKAKFLEDPTRTLANSGELGTIVTGVVKAGASIMKGLIVAGLRILRESDLEVPVDTSHLKGSGTVRKDRL